MKKLLSLLLCAVVLALTLMPAVPVASAREEVPNLTGLIRNSQR